MDKPDPEMLADTADLSRRHSWSRIASYAKSERIRCLILVLFGTIVHIPAVTGEFLWDDIPLVKDNPLIRSPILILEAFRHYLFPDTYGGHYRPIQTVSYIVDYFVWNKEAFGYHLSNLVWHTLSGLLLFYLLRRIFERFAERWPDNTRNIGPSTIAFFLALIWMIHPVHSAAIDYVSGRADSLAFLFAASGWLLFLRARTASSVWIGRSIYALATLCALCSLCSRESGALWLLVFLLWLLVFDAQIGSRIKLVTLVVCLAVTATYIGLHRLPDHREEVARSADWTPAMRGVLMLRALGDYGRLFIFPSRLHLERTVFEPALGRTRSSWREAIATEYLSIVGIAVMAILVLGAFLKGVGRPARLFGVSWFFVTYLPTSNLLSLNATVAEHWLYLPSVGLCVFLGGIFLDLPRRYLRPAGVFTCIAIAGLSMRSFTRSTDWIDPETFFRRTFAAGGSNSRIGVNLGLIYTLRGEYGKAEDILRKVLQVSPDYILARNNLGVALSRQGKTKEAEALYKEANNSTADARVVAYPRTWEAARNLARIRHSEKDDAAALSTLDRALQDFPGNWELIALKARIIHEVEGPTQATLILNDFVQDHWWHAEASMMLGALCLESGDRVRAEKAFSHASVLDVHDASALNQIALIYVSEDQLEAAYKVQSRALARERDQPRQYLILAGILSKMGRAKEAEEAAAQAHRLMEVAKSQVAVTNFP